MVKCSAEDTIVHAHRIAQFGASTGDLQSIRMSRATAYADLNRKSECDLNAESSVQSVPPKLKQTNDSRR